MTGRCVLGTVMTALLAVGCGQPVPAAPTDGTPGVQFLDVATYHLEATRHAAAEFVVTVRTGCSGELDDPTCAAHADQVAIRAAELRRAMIEVDSPPPALDRVAELTDRMAAIDDASQLLTTAAELADHLERHVLR